MAPGESSAGNTTSLAFREKSRANKVTASQFELAQPPSDAISALSYAPESPTKLLVSCWDKKIYLYDTHSGGEEAPGTLLKTIEFRAPVLDVCFGATDDEAYAACLDHCVYR